jgi:hypothetical protein
MSVYYIIDNRGIIYELDATTEITYQETGTTTDNIIETGESVADHYINNPVKITLRGSISDIKALSSSGPNSKSTRDYINGLRRLKINKQSFTFHFGEKVGSFGNCFFEELNITQNQSRGNVGGLDSFNISANIKQIRLARRARVVPAREAGIPTDNYQEQTQGTSTTAEPEGDNLDRLIRERARLTQQLVDLDNPTGG